MQNRKQVRVQATMEVCKNRVHEVNYYVHLFCNINLSDMYMMENSKHSRID